MRKYLLSNLFSNQKSLILNPDNSNQQATMNQPECSLFFFLSLDKTTSVALKMSFPGIGLTIANLRHKRTTELNVSKGPSPLLQSVVQPLKVSEDTIVNVVGGFLFVFLNIIILPPK